jgi:hypothetical protein
LLKGPQPYNGNCRPFLNKTLFPSYNRYRHPAFVRAMILKTAVVGLKMAHLREISLAFEFFNAHPEGARVAR